MARSTLQPRGQVTIPKSVRDEVGLAPGDIVEIRAAGPHKVVIEVIPVKPLEYFWQKFATARPYEDDALRREWQEIAAADAIDE